MSFLEDFESAIEDANRPEISQLPWMATKKFVLVTEEMLPQVIDECIAATHYSLDLETTGLDTRIFDGRTRDQIVGYCLSADGETGYYIPVRHQKGTEHNLPLQLVYEQMVRLVESKSVAIFHNAKFDQEFLTAVGLGLWDTASSFEDTLFLAWLKDTREKKVGLKPVAKRELGFEMIELKELFPLDYQGKFDFSLLDPSWLPCLWYAGSDAICTYLLFHKLYSEVITPTSGVSQKPTYQIEKACVPAVRWMERNRVFINREKISELLQLGQKEYFDALVEVYDFCNHALDRIVEPEWFKLLRTTFVQDKPDFDILAQIEDCRIQKAKAERTNDKIEKHITLEIGEEMVEFTEFPVVYDILSPKQIGTLLCELGIPSLTRTGKSGQIKSSQDEIDRLTEAYGDTYSFLPKIKRMNELRKAIGTYLVSLLNDTAPDGTIKIDYRQNGTDTGRFTTPTPEDPALTGGTSYPMHGTPATYDKTRPQCLLRVREGIHVRKPTATMVSCDFSGVELRIGTFLSGEEHWVREFFRCSTCNFEFDRGDGTRTPDAPPGYCPCCGDDRIGDLHTSTGIVFFGEDAVGGPNWKQERNSAKAANFSLAYGGGVSAIMRATGCDKQTGARHHLNFTKKHTGLVAWWDETKRFARKYGYVLTAFNRKYPIPDILLPTDPKKVREKLMENPAKFSYMIYQALRAKSKINSKITSLDNYPFSEENNPLTIATLQAIGDYRKDILAGKKKQAPDEGIKRHFRKIAQEVETLVVEEQAKNNRSFKAKGERNATNGPIQGLSADITKIAMAFIYKECKKRGWLDKVLMLITIHDELVFEIDNDILVEAIDMICTNMSRNKAILAQKWCIPLTTDCEIGDDWTVPWNIKNFQYGRVRSDGVEVDAKGNPTKKSWPEKYLKIFGPVYGFYDAPLNKPANIPAIVLKTEDVPIEQTSIEETSIEETPIEQTPIEQTNTSEAIPPAEGSPVPSPKKDPFSDSLPPEPFPGVIVESNPPRSKNQAASPHNAYVFQVPKLSPIWLVILAKAICRCKGTGSQKLTIKAPSGEILYTLDNNGGGVSQALFTHTINIYKDQIRT